MLVQQSTIFINLKQIRESKGLTQRRLATLIGTTDETVAKYEQGRAKQIPLDLLSKICEVLDCNPGDILVKK